MGGDLDSRNPALFIPGLIPCRGEYSETSSPDTSRDRLAASAVHAAQVSRYARCGSLPRLPPAHTYLDSRTVPASEAERAADGRGCARTTMQ